MHVCILVSDEMENTVHVFWYRWPHYVAAVRPPRFGLEAQGRLTIADRLTAQSSCLCRITSDSSPSLYLLTNMPMSAALFPIVAFFYLCTKLRNPSSKPEPEAEDNLTTSQPVRDILRMSLGGNTSFLFIKAEAAAVLSEKRVWLNPTPSTRKAH